MAKTIITLGREYCTGGRYIAEDVANALGIKLYDKELITMAAKHSGLSEEAVAASEKRHTHSLLYSLYTKTNPLVKAKDEKGIKEEVEKTDRNRSAYYNYYTQNRWGDAHNYDLAINAALGRETCVKMILDAAAAKEKTLG